ncbi:hypothetical protein OAF56_04870 [Pirellulaceae bacterium]|jgi:hypothetical protein|nr:hypothetical protein [Pirellulaceae bacterium]MDB4640949.1 hypothetical protein [Pirellulaceae bacterium]
MKKLIIVAAALFICMPCTGCQAWRDAFAPKGSSPVHKWDSNFKRSQGVGTGVDPMAQDIESRLGYQR